MSPKFVWKWMRRWYKSVDAICRLDLHDNCSDHSCVCVNDVCLLICGEKDWRQVMSVLWGLWIHIYLAFGGAPPVRGGPGRAAPAARAARGPLALGALNRGGGVRILRSSLERLRTILEWMAHEIQ